MFVDKKYIERFEETHVDIEYQDEKGKTLRITGYLFDVFDNQINIDDKITIPIVKVKKIKLAEL